MKAIVVEEFGAPEIMKLNDIDTPKPGIGEVLVKNEAIGVNPVDTYIRAGMYPVLPSLPYTPGMDAAGTVVEVGDEVNSFKKGDMVYLSHAKSGTYSEYSLCQEDHVYSLPNNVEFKKGAAVGVPCGAAWRALYHRAHLKAGERLLVHGASGSVGIAAIQLAVASGAKVIGTAGTDKGRQLVMDNGAELALDHKSTDYHSDLMEATKSSGFDVILEMLANVNLEKDLEMLSPRGRVIVVGNRGKIEIDPRLTMGKETEIKGMSLFNATSAELMEMHAALFGALKAGFLDPVISLELDLNQAPEAHEKVMENGNCGKIVLMPGK